MGRMIPLTEGNWVRDTAILRTEEVCHQDGSLKELLVYTSGAGTIRLGPAAGQLLLDNLWAECEGETPVISRSRYRRLDGGDCEEDVL